MVPSVGRREVFRALSIELYELLSEEEFVRFVSGTKGRVLAAEKDYDGFYDLDEAMHQLICEFGSSHQIWRIVTGAKARLDRV
jgi:hypothetical protein